MKKYMIIMRGNQDTFLNLSKSQQETVIKDYLDWVDILKNDNAFVAGSGLDHNSVKLVKDKDIIRYITNPYAHNEEQLSGYFIILADNMEKAIEIAKSCPSLKFGESVEVIALGH